MIRSGRFSPVFFFQRCSLTAATTATAQQPGITDTEIRFGNIMPYSGENDSVAFMFGNMGTAPSSAKAHETGWRRSWCSHSARTI